MFDFNFKAPGWQAREKDLSTPAPEVPGITPVIMVGEYPQGPAFEPFTTRNPTSFTRTMGLRSNARLNGQPRYMANFLADSILQESNELVNIRVLGLSGYTAGPSWALVTNTGTLVGTLRSRGFYPTTLASAPTFHATAVTADSITDALNSFEITITGPQGASTFVVSLNQDAPDYIVTVFGRSAFDRTTPVFVESIFPERLRMDVENDVVSGLDIIVGINGNTDFLSRYRSAETPWLVSQLQGNNVSRLLRFITISDGNEANAYVKFTIENLDLATATFDVLIRSFSDTDETPVILERFTGLNMNPDSSNYVLARMGGRIEGNTQNEFDLKTEYCITEVAANAAVGLVPCGFEGYYKFTNDETVFPSPSYKTTFTEFDKPGRFSFGVSERAYDATSRGRALDGDHFRFPGNLTVLTGKKGLGFHLDNNAAIILDDSDTSVFAVGPGNFTTVNHQTESDNIYLNKRNRRFTVVPAGGFDGWNIYRTERTNKDAHIAITNSDYYAWMAALDLLKNPLDAPGEILLTPGLNFADHLSLVNYAFEVVEDIDNRGGDCVYLVDAPDLGAEPGSVKDVRNLFENSGLQSSFGAWSYPWIQTSNPDAGNSLLYVSPLGEHARIMALTDKTKAKWFAPAGMLRGAMPRIRQARKRLSEPERQDIHAARGNAVITSPRGLVDLFNNNTMLPVDSNSPLTSLNVRRGLLYLRRTIGEIAQGIVLEEQSDAVAVQTFLTRVTPILEKMKRERGLFAYQLSESIPETIEGNDRKSKYFLIQVKPIEALEYIGFTIAVGEGGASVSEV